MTTRLRHPIVLVLTGLVAGLAVGVVACSSDSVSGTGATGAKLNMDGYAGASCELRGRCESALTFKPDWGDVASCTSRTSPELAKDFNVPGVTLTQAQVDTCASKLRGAACTDGSDKLGECIFKGSRATGTKCYGNAQCQSGSCYYTETGACGVCTERVPVGGDCTKAACERGLGCVITGGTATAPKAECIAFVGEGANCRGSAECAGNLYCIEGKCGKPLGPDATCVLATQAAPFPAPCDPLQSLLCLPVDNTPTAASKCKAVKFVNVGEKCGLDPNTAELAFCVSASCSGQQTGTCVPDLKEGAACKEDDSVVCEFPLACSGGVCARGIGPDTCN